MLLRLNIFLKLWNAEVIKGKNQEITAAWPLSKNPLLDFSYDYRAYPSLGDSHLPPTDSDNSQTALEHEKEAWTIYPCLSPTSFISLKKINLFCLFKKKNHNHVFLSYRNLAKFQTVFLLHMRFPPVTILQIYWKQLPKSIQQEFFSRMIIFFTYINICSFQQQKFQDFKLPTICCIMKRLSSTF